MDQKCIYELICIETYNKCTRQCPWCINGVKEDYRNRKPEKLEERYIIDVFKDLKSLGYNGIISFSGSNEPLLDNRISDGSLIKLCKEILGNSIKIVIITNGDLLTTDILECMINSGLDLLEVSCYENKILEKTSRMHDLYKDKINFTFYDYRDSSVLRHNHGGSIQWGEMNNIQTSCFMPMFTSKIRSDGKVCLCILESEGRIDLGNIKEKSYKDLLKSRELNLLKRKIALDRKSVHPCVNCNFHGQIVKV